jgi:hypothetical protein
MHDPPKYKVFHAESETVQELTSIADYMETAFDKLDRLENEHNK